MMGASIREILESESPSAETARNPDWFNEYERLDQLTSPDPRQRCAAALDLGEMSRYCCYAFRPLLACLDDDDDRVRTAATAALPAVVQAHSGYLPHPAHRRYLPFLPPGWKRRLIVEGPDGAQKEAMACNLRTTILALLFLLDDEDWLMRFLAAIDIAELGPVLESRTGIEVSAPQILPVLIEGTTHEKEGIREPLTATACPPRAPSGYRRSSRQSYPASARLTHHLSGTGIHDAPVKWPVGQALLAQLRPVVELPLASRLAIHRYLEIALT